MHLDFLEIVNFRGISQLRLDLEPGTTMLFGENAWGKTSLVEALATVLGSRPLTEADFYRISLGKAPIARRLGMTLGFKGEPEAALERVTWLNDAGEALCVLSLSAKRLGRGRLRIARRFLNAHGQAWEDPHTEELVDLLVKTHPLYVFRDLRLADWMLASVLPSGPVLREDPTEAISRLFERLLTLPHQVHPDELGRGMEALQRLAEQRPELFLSMPQSGRRRAEDMADAPVSLVDGVSLKDLAHRAGAGTRQVALLAIVGAMLHAESEAPHAVGARPILLLEDPEAHLHPIQLATAWSLVEQLPVQKIVSTTRGELLASQPSRSLRRLVRRKDHVEVFPKDGGHLSRQDARKVAFHIRTHRAEALFARVWLLVEGETEAWLLPELARIWGLNFPLEGISCVEFAQAGLDPLIHYADRFGIPWHLVADGDDAGRSYMAKARKLLKGRPTSSHLTLLPVKDLEHLLWLEGYSSLFLQAAGSGPEDPPSVIARALRRTSKPGMALELAEAAGERGPSGVPSSLRLIFERLRKLVQRG